MNTPAPPSKAQQPHSHAQRWLLAYDIREPRRLNRVGRYLRQEGLRLQYSVYLMTGSREQMQSVMDKLSQLIDKSADDVRLYPITENTRIWGLGTQFNDDGNTLSDAFLDRLIQSGKSSTKTEQADNELNFDR